jgi:hypothetical protein
MLLSLMTRSTYGDTLRLYNNECFGLAEDALKNANWKQHSDNLEGKNFMVHIISFNRCCTYVWNSDIS